MGKKRVVLDTNILISSMAWKGNPAKILEKVINRNIELFISPEQFKELERVLEYPKFNFSEEQKTRVKNLILKIAKVVYPMKKVDVIKDDSDDNMILECALSGNVDYIVTGDHHLLNLKEFKSIKIVTASEFLE
ncbi:putative toxin-antitoxin system toxin component, PIN family [archaeon]|nr:putative toxin-antitoxin system toxin component, PIN family [archaeon]